MRYPEIRKSLVAIRKAQGMTQQDVATQLGLTRAAVGFRELPEEHPKSVEVTLSEIESWADALGVGFSANLFELGQPRTLEQRELVGLFLRALAKMNDLERSRHLAFLKIIVGE